MKYRLFTLFFILLAIHPYQSLKGQPPIGYYDAADQKKGSDLKSAFHAIIRNHIYLDYDTEVPARYWWDNYFKKTDWHPNGYYWDMYSNEKRSTYNGSVQNREHLMPRSWWGVTSDYALYDANGDLHNLYPSDQKANSAKLNYPLGKVGKTIFDNGVVKVGDNTYPLAYKGVVFEPADEYKGDFARVYFYMVTCYEDYYSNWRSIGLSSALNKEIYPVLQDWVIKMLLEWHAEDPVSEKEIIRNNKTFEIQQNRNPFVDYPELADYIWGNKSTDFFVVEDKAEDPILITPSNDIVIDFGETTVNQVKKRSIPIKGKGLRGNISVRLVNNAFNCFSVPINSISTLLINKDEGYEMEVIYNPIELGDHTANVIFYDGGIEGSISVGLKATCAAIPTAINDEQHRHPYVYVLNNVLQFDNIEEGTLIEVYNINGSKIISFKLNENEIRIDERGVYIVKIKNVIFKIII